MAGVLHRDAVCCSVLQRVAACCSVLQRVAGVLQRVAARMSTAAGDQTSSNEWQVC